jgi:hypothetical protein
MEPQHVMDRRVAYVGVNVLLERQREPTSLRLGDNIKMDFKALEWTVWTCINSVINFWLVISLMNFTFPNNIKLTKHKSMKWNPNT